MSELGRLLVAHTDETGRVCVSGIKAAVQALGLSVGHAMFRAYMMGLEAY